MNPKIATWPEINWWIENIGWLKGLQKKTRLALSGVALAVLQACSPAQAAENPQDKAQVIKVASNNAETPVIDTVISSGETGGSVEKLSEEAIFSELEELIKTEIPEDQWDKYLWTDERKWYIEQIAANDTPRKSKFHIIIWLGEWRGWELLNMLPESYTEIHNSIKYEGTKIKLSIVNSVSEAVNN